MNFTRRQFVKQIIKGSTAALFVPHILPLWTPEAEAASTIETQTISAVTEQCIALAASQFGRAHGYGDNWNTLRIGLNCNFESSGASLVGTVLRIGLCHGTTHMPGDATTDNSYGIKFQPAWYYHAGSDYAVNPTPYPNAFSRVGTTETLSATDLNGRIGLVGLKRVCFFLDIIKGSPNYTFKVFMPSSSGTFADSTPAIFLAQVTSLTPTLTACSYTSPTGTGLAINTGTNGVLDTVYVGWNMLTPRFFIGNLAVVRLA